MDCAVLGASPDPEVGPGALTTWRVFSIPPMGGAAATPLRADHGAVHQCADAGRHRDAGALTGPPDALVALDRAAAKQARLFGRKQEFDPQILNHELTSTMPTTGSEP